jgi:putative hydrolase of the HAD superfamily
VIDSRVVGCAKPNPAIYAIALDRLKLPASAVMMVGDSYERDIVPAHSLGMRAIWLVPEPAGKPRGVADAVVSALAELPPLLHQLQRIPA